MATVQYTAIQCPSIVTLASFYSRADAYSAPGTNVPVSQTITAGDTNLVSKFDANALGTDLASAYGGGGFAVARGLTLSIGSGLNITVAKGHAAIAGVVELNADTTLGIPDNTPNAWIWILQNGTVTYTTSTAPSAACCLLGCATTSGGIVVNVDTSGVLYLKGGTLWRQTADTSAPTDTPPSSITFTAVTLGGTYWWDGASYKQLGQATSDLSSLLLETISRVELLERAMSGLVFQLVDGCGIDNVLGDEYVTLFLEAN